ncbi:hypothetical protein M8J77_009831 [Diaphorina citri]|nr:hypothetical protein M8J77_009831 [Diaphorina citri]
MVEQAQHLLADPDPLRFRHLQRLVHVMRRYEGEAIQKVIDPLCLHTPPRERQQSVACYRPLPQSLQEDIQNLSILIVFHMVEQAQHLLADPDPLRFRHLQRLVHVMRRYEGEAIQKVIDPLCLLTPPQEWQQSVACYRPLPQSLQDDIQNLSIQTSVMIIQFVTSIRFNLELKALYLIPEGDRYNMNVPPLITILCLVGSVAK